MAEVTVRLDKAMGTSLIMLYGLAADAHADSPLLGDTIAEQAFEKVDYDFGPLRRKLPPRLIGLSVASRAKHFDDRTTEFLAAHDEATMVNLGAGLDSRVWRVEGASLHWAIDSPADLERRNPRLRCTDSVSGLVPLLHTAIPARYKAFIRLALLVPTVRDAGLYVRYVFGD